MAEGGAGVIAAPRCMNGSPQMFTDWDGLLDDLFHNKGLLKRVKVVVVAAVVVCVENLI